jgi:hypothetical protein
MRRIAIVILGIGLIAACDDPAGIAPPIEGAPLDISNGPSEPSDVVLRIWDTQFFLLLNSDRASGLISVVRAPDPPGDFVPCGGSQWLDPAAVQLVFHPNGAVNQLLMASQVHAAVYERRSFNTALRNSGLCGALATQTPLASGLVDGIVHDNETFFTGVHADAFGFSIRGILHDAGGATLTYSNQYHGVLAASGDLVHLVSRISVKPASN